MVFPQVELWGPSAIKELYPCSNSSACSAGWSVRRRLMANTPSLVSKAAEHFGIGASALTEGVELEQVPPPHPNLLLPRCPVLFCAWLSSESHLPLPDKPRRREALPATCSSSGSSTASS